MRDATELVLEPKGGNKLGVLQKHIKSQNRKRIVSKERGG